MDKIVITKEQLAKMVNEQSGENTLKTFKEPKLYKLNDKVVKLLSERLEDEYRAHYLYRAAANWCHEVNYKKAAVFFDKEASSELEHAQLLEKYMTDFNILPVINKTETKHEFTNLFEIIYAAYELELGLMKSYNEVSHEVFEDDLTTFDFLKKFRKFTRDAVVEFNDLINASNLIDKTSKFEVLYFEQTYF